MVKTDYVIRGEIMKVILTYNRLDGDMVEMYGTHETANELIAVFHKDCLLWDDIYTELEYHGTIECAFTFNKDA